MTIHKCEANRHITMGHPEGGYKFASSHKLWVFLSTRVTVHCEKYVMRYFEVSAVLGWLSSLM